MWSKQKLLLKTEPLAFKEVSCDAVCKLCFSVNRTEETLQVKKKWNKIEVNHNLRLIVD